MHPAATTMLPTATVVVPMMTSSDVPLPRATLPTIVIPVVTPPGAPLAAAAHVAVRAADPPEIAGALYDPPPPPAKSKRRPALGTLDTSVGLVSPPPPHATASTSTIVGMRFIGSSWAS